MKRSLLLSIGIMALLFTACNKAEYGITPDNSNTTIKAVMDADETKSTVSNYSFYWSAGDKINVWYAKDNSTRSVEFTLSGNGGVTSGTFTGTTVEGETCTGYAVYPSGSHSMTNGAITVNMPAVYGNNNTEYVANTNAAMIAEPASSTVATNSETTVPSLYFKHVGGVLAFTIKNVPAGANQFIFTANMPITGAFTVANNQITATEPEQDATVTNNTVTINFKPLTAEAEAMTFYVPLPTGTYKGFKAEVKTSAGNAVMTYETSTANTLSRAGLAEMTLVITDVNAGTPAQEVSTTQQLQNAVSNGGNFILTENVTTGALNIPTNTELSLNLGGKTLTIGTASPQTYALTKSSSASENRLANNGKLTISNGTILIEGTDAAIDNYSEISITNSTITMSDHSASSDFAIFNWLNATATIDNCTITGPVYNVGNMTVTNNTTIKSTAANRLALLCGDETKDYAWNFTMTGGSIISEQHTGTRLVNNLYLDTPGLATFNGVTITGKKTANSFDAVLAAVNVKFENCTITNDWFWLSGANYTSKINGEDSKKEKLYGCSFIDMFPINDEESLFNALDSGVEEIKISDASTAITLSKSIVIASGKVLTLDLNGGTLNVVSTEGIDWGIDNSGTITIKNGNITMANATNSSDYAISNRLGATASIDNCIITGSVYNVGNMTVTNNTTIKSTAENRLALFCGDETKDYAWNFTMTGGSIISEQHTGTRLVNNLYLDNPGLATFNGVTITGKKTANSFDAVLAAVNVKFEDCTITNDWFWLSGANYISKINGEDSKKEKLYGCSFNDMFPTTEN